MSLRSSGFAIAVSAVLVAMTLLWPSKVSDEVEMADQVDSTTTTSTIPSSDALPARSTPTTVSEFGVASEALGFADLLELQRVPIPDASAASPASAGQDAAVSAASAEGNAGAASSPAAIRIPTPSCATSPGATRSVTAPLTGKPASIPSGMPAVVVKVSNNSSASRANLIGLDRADIVYEERIEASATRFAAVFHSTFPQNVGPVRSGRTTDIDLIRNLNTPVFGYSGSNDGVARQIEVARANGWLVPFVNTDRAPFARDRRFSAPDNLFVDPAMLGQCGNGGSPPGLFTHSSTLPAAAQPASSVSLDARSSFRFDWNAGTGSWDRSQSGSAHVTREGVRLSPDNVAVLFVDYLPSAIDKNSVDAITMGSGEAWVFRNGTVTVGSWSRPRVLDGFAFTASDGSSAPLAPGNSWVVLAPAGSASWS